MKIVMGWTGRRVLDERRKTLWCGKPDEKIGVAVLHAPHSARSAEITLAWKREG